MTTAALPSETLGGRIGAPPRLRQVWAVARLELRRSLTILGILVLLGLAFAPSAIIAAHAAVDKGCNLAQETIILGAIVQVYHIRFALFFGCLGIFMRMIRGEVSEKTLHYVFLAPVRREVVIAGKFLAGVLLTTAVFVAGITTAFALMYAHFPAGRDFATGQGLTHLGWYLLAATLACIGYGAVFLALSLVFKNPIVPAVVVLLWEGLNGFLPVALKHFSVTFYLKPLMPVELPAAGWVSGLLTVVAEPTPTWAAILGLLLFALGVLVFACWKIRKMDISYSTD